MILDLLENCGKYKNVHPRFKKAFEFLESNNLKELPLGKIQLEGSDLVINVVDITGKDKDAARMETHNNFIDIQIPIGATETMGWKALTKLTQITDGYNAEKDITFYGDEATSFINVEPFEFAVFFPEDGHQPGIAEGTYRKIIVKIRV
ncbi:MAG TPA: YhcH/YjgK/YiaL family protein [Paludibacter sp.]|nr:YhcH/YjgK/YiaL family protein [Paludibacter sp.]